MICRSSGNAQRTEDGRWRDFVSDEIATPAGKRQNIPIMNTIADRKNIPSPPRWSHCRAWCAAGGDARISLLPTVAQGDSGDPRLGQMEMFGTKSAPPRRSTQHILNP